MRAALFGTWNWISLYWLVWFVVGFGLVETWAIVTKRPQDTLSDQIWRFERTFGPPWTWTWQHWLFVVLWTALSVWLWGHFTEHIWR